jgi:hypothetical protein
MPRKIRSLPISSNNSIYSNRAGKKGKPQITQITQIPMPFWVAGATRLRVLCGYKFFWLRLVRAVCRVNYS